MGNDMSKFESKVNPESLQLLFNADPEELTTEDVQLICQELRKQRANFIQVDNVKKLQGGKAKELTKNEADQLTLGDLDL